MGAKSRDIEACHFCSTMTPYSFTVYTGSMYKGKPSLLKKPCCLKCIKKEPDQDYETALLLLGRVSKYKLNEKTGLYVPKEEKQRRAPVRETVLLPVVQVTQPTRILTPVRAKEKRVFISPRWKAAFKEEMFHSKRQIHIATLPVLSIIVLCLWLYTDTLHAASPIQVVQHLVAAVSMSASTATTQTVAASNASTKLARISQTDASQYDNQAEFALWSPSACSAASMTEVINAYGHSYQIKDILKAEIAKGAISVAEGLMYGIDSIRVTVNQFGFSATQVQGATLDGIVATANAGTPVIVSFPPGAWTGGHILVLRGGNATTVTLADSSNYNWTTVTRATFLKYWRGWAVVVTPSTTVASSDVSVVGTPTISVAKINAILASYGSPASGKGQALYDDGVTYGINPAVALAFFVMESKAGTKGEATKTLALGNERCIAGRACVDQNRGGYAQFTSWEDGFTHWYQMIKLGYVQGGINSVIGRSACPCTTVARIVPVYAPNSDNNNELTYIRTVVGLVNSWK